VQVVAGIQLLPLTGCLLHLLLLGSFDLARFSRQAVRWVVRRACMLAATTTHRRQPPP